MAEYIEREAFRKKLAVGAEYLDEDTLLTVVNLLDCEPAADVAPVVNGRWETVPNREFDGFETVVRGKAERCTNCCRASKEFKKWFAICPNCGAKMDATDINVGDKGGKE